MKLEKREITLNEYDSLKDIFHAEKLLLLEYVHALEKVERKETKNELIACIAETANDMLFACDLLRGSAIQNGEK